MNLSAFAGNHAVKAQLSQQEEGRGLSHAYILSGPAGSGKHTLARLLCGAMLCAAPAEGRPCGRCGPCKKVFAGIHPDVSVISGPGEGKPIAVDQVRQLRSDAYIRPNEGARKIYLLENADRMNASAQNAMLKLLEEGPAYAVFLLLAENGGGLLRTVRSRCEELALAPVSPGEAEAWLRESWAGPWTCWRGAARPPRSAGSRQRSWCGRWRAATSWPFLRPACFWSGRPRRSCPGCWISCTFSWESGWLRRPRESGC